MFAQKVLPGLVKHAEDKSTKYPPTLNFHWSYGVYQGQLLRMSALCEPPSSQCELCPCRLRGSMGRKECILRM